MIVQSILITFLLVTQIGMAKSHDHSHHPPHNMVLFGTQQTFASHIVYKKPHHYQVILEVRLDATTRELYTDTLTRHSADSLILLLGEMDIGLIEKKPLLTAKLIQRLASGERKVLRENIQLRPEDYKIIFFNEVPLNLEP